MLSNSLILRVTQPTDGLPSTLDFDVLARNPATKVESKATSSGKCGETLAAVRRFCHCLPPPPVADNWAGGFAHIIPS
jgi:hypothetical protein